MTQFAATTHARTTGRASRGSYRAALAALAALASLPSFTAVRPARTAPLDQTFAKSTPGSASTVDHSAWDRLLKTYVVPSADGLNRVAYARFKADGRAELKRYLSTLERVNPDVLDRPEQFAFWANLYNAKTIDIVLDKFPVKSIKDISLGGGLLAAVTGGPWKAKVVTVKGEALSLDDIEHGILRGIFHDPRVHYAVNCASIGCPNLMAEAFTGAKLETQLDAGARAYVNHQRGLKVDAGRVTASSIFSWFQADFGGTAQGVLDHARKYAAPALMRKLEGITTIAEFDYDWRLNDTQG